MEGYTSSPPAQERVVVSIILKRAKGSRDEVPIISLWDSPIRSSKKQEESWGVTVGDR